MKPKYFWFLQGLLVLALVAAIAPAAMADSNTVSYQGTLRDATLSPVADGNYPLVFSIWDDATAGTKRWGDESHPAVQTTNGMFSVYLGSTVPLGNVFALYSALWLEISADTGSGMETYAPRVPLASVPYAQYAQHGVPIGTILPVYIGLAGVPSVADLQARGWALCNGTTPASQGIANPVITVATPDLNNTGRFIRGGTTAGTVQADSVGAHNHPAGFSGGSTNTVGDHTHSFSATTSSHGGHQHAQNVTANFGSGGPAWRVDFGGDGSGAGVYSQGASTDAGGAHNHTVSGTTGGGGGHSHTVSGTVTVNNNTGTTETRPINMSMVYFIKVR
jgi:hypothetical protein